MKTVTPKREELARSIKDSSVKKIIEAAAFFALGFTLSSCFVLRVASPFSVSLISVSKKNNFLYSAIGSALGYLVFCPDNFARYAVAVVIVALGTFALALAEAKNQPWFPMLLSFMSLLATGIVVNVKLGVGAAQYALVFAESVLGLGGAYFFFRSINCNFRRFRFKALPVSDLTCIITSVSVILMGLSRLTVVGFSPARAVSVLIILLTAHYGADRLGLILALVLGFSLGVEDTGTVFLAGAYAFSTMLATIFCAVNTWSAAVSFILCVALFSVASGSEAGIFITLESAVGSVAFALMPRFVTSKIEGFFHDGADIAPDGSLRQSLVVRLRFASSAMHHISESVNEVREKINDINARNAQKSRADLTEQEYIAQEVINEKTNEIRMVASDQFFSISDMLADLAKEFDEAEYFDNIAAGKIRRLLGEYEIYPRNISVIEDKFGMMRIEIMTKGRETAISKPEILKQISKICNR